MISTKASSRWCRRATVLVLAALISSLWAPQAADAHVDLEAACPGLSEVVNEARSVELGFSGPILLNEVDTGSINVMHVASEQLVETGPLHLDGVRAAGVDIVGTLPDGRYRVAYQIVSDDGDNNTGAFEFIVDAADENATNCEDPDVGNDGGSDILGIIILALPLVVVVGGLWFTTRWAAKRRDELA